MPSQPPPAYRAISLVGLLILSFVVGALVADSGLWPYEPILKRGFLALRVQVSDMVRVGLHGGSDVWAKARTSETGVTSNDPRAFDGFTLYASGHGPQAYLIDTKGEVVHSWEVPFEKAYPEAEHASDPIGERTIYFRRVHVFANGDLLAIYEADGDTPYGLGLVRVDRDSEVKWAVDERVHHDFEVAKDGTITTLTHRLRDLSEEPLPVETRLEGWVVEDFIVQFDSEGRELRRMSVLDGLARSSFHGYLGQNQYPEFEGWDPVHANDASVIGAQFASHFSFAEPGMVMTSMRTLDLVALADVDRGEFVWATRGPWQHQHDPDPLPDGWVQLFDNLGKTTPGGRSRIIEFHPVTGAIRWTYAGTLDEPFQSLIRGSQQRLPNGNVLIVESDGARILEVSRDGEPVWEFRNPTRRRDGEEVAVIADAIRVAPSAVPFVR